MAPLAPPRRARNALEQYEDLAGSWWDQEGPFAALHWLAEARGRLIPPPARAGAVLVDLGCGGGVLAPHVPTGYEHVGVDLNPTALAAAAERGVRPIEASADAVPLPDGCADVVVAGELFEHVEDLPALVAECARLLAPGGLLVYDTIADTLWARLSLVWIGERMPGGPPPRIHDPRLFVSPDRVHALLRAEGLEPLELFGLQPDPPAYLRFIAKRSTHVTMVRTRSTAALYQGTAGKPSAG